ncbi:MAG: hypothetical protein IIA61_02380 [Candidatus Marinimicrobia bacterium]|nr:hypothetical protein [Candidatus Neomarinimicrobiota bacterium]
MLIRWVTHSEIKLWFDDENKRVVFSTRIFNLKKEILQILINVNYLIVNIIIEKYIVKKIGGSIGQTKIPDKKPGIIGTSSNHSA